MRLTVLIIGLLLGLMLTLQSMTIGVFSETSAVDDTTASAGGAGLLMALAWLLACGLVIPFPLASTIIFAVTVPIGLFTPTGDFGDLRFHGFAAIVLAVMSYLGWRGKRKAETEKVVERRRQEARDSRLEALLSQQRVPSPSAAMSTIPCPSCGHLSGPNARFCEACGTRIMRTMESSGAPRASKVSEMPPASSTSKNDWFDAMRNRSS